MLPISGTPYTLSEHMRARLEELSGRVAELRASGKLTEEELLRLSRYFRIRHIYHSNAIEGNKLDLGETRRVVEEGITLSGKSLKDQAEAKGLAEAIDLVQSLASENSSPIAEHEIRQLHQLVLKGEYEAEGGQYRHVPIEISGAKFTPPAPEKLRDELDAFWAWFGPVSARSEDRCTATGFINAVVAHTWFVSIHPFVDGNGRTSRLLLNLMLMRFGFPVAIICLSDRRRFYSVLQQSDTGDLDGLLELVADCLEESIGEWKRARSESSGPLDVLLAGLAAGPNSGLGGNGAAASYLIWKNAMESLASAARANTNFLAREVEREILVRFEEYTLPDVYGWASIHFESSRKRTWLFRIELQSGVGTTRYLFSVGAASQDFRDANAAVSVHAERTPRGTNLPPFCELGDLNGTGLLRARTPDGVFVTGRAEALLDTFMQQAIELHRTEVGMPPQPAPKSET